MPLYKKSTLKAKVKTQTSFISPLLTISQSQPSNLIKDDYKENLNIPTHKKILEPLINIANDGNLLEKLQQKSFTDSLKKSVEVIDAKESHSNNVTSPMLFDSPSALLKTSNKSLKTENSMTVTATIEVSSTTDGDIFDITKASDTPNSKISDMLNECVINNLRMSQQQSRNLDNSARQINVNSLKNYNEDDLDSSLGRILDDLVNTNIILSQSKMNDYEKKNKSNKKKERNNINCTENFELKKNKSHGNKDHESDGMQNSIINEEEDDLDSSLKSILDDIVNTNIILSQNKMNDYKKKNKSSKKKERNNIKSKKDFVLKKYKSHGDKDIEPVKKKYKQTKGDLEKATKKSNYNVPKTNDNHNVSLFDGGQLSSNVSSSKNHQKKGQKPKDGDVGERLKQKLKKKYLIKKEKSIKSKTENNTNMVEKQNLKNKKSEKKLKELGKESNRFGGKKLDKKKSLTIISRNSIHTKQDSVVDNSNKKQQRKDKASCSRKHKNMIFTSENPKANNFDLNELFELQEKRDIGLYVYCDRCDKVRYLKNCKDPLELPDKWYCSMNPDPKYNKCTDPNFEVEPEKEELMIHNKFNAGSIVWAKMDGYPWWPAMVDDDPDVKDYFWLDGDDVLEPSWYHVTFFDSSDVTRAWIRKASLQPFEINEKNPFFKPKKTDYYKSRVTFAVQEAKRACKKSILERLRLYSFVSRYVKKETDREKNKKSAKADRKANDADKKSSKYLNDNNNTDNTAKQQDLNKADLDENNSCDTISISSSDISHILKQRKIGKGNRICSSEEILGNIDFNHFICNEDDLDNFS